MLTNVSRSVTSEQPPSRGRSVRLVPFLFGIAHRLDRTELPGPVLVRLLGDLGLTAPAARALIARMRRDGQLAGERHGRMVDYRLVGEFLRAFERIRTAATGPAWSGQFHTVLYQVPEPHRAFRDQLRRIATFAGYGLLQQGVLISPTDRREQLRPTLAAAPAGAQVLFGELRLTTADAARAAYQAWDLAPLARTYRRHTRTLRAAIDRRGTPKPDGRTLRRLADLLGEPLVDTLRATTLPPELTPPDWPLPGLRAAIDELQRGYLPPTVEYLSGLLDATE
jgi:phenylacetic acid degradation operon negative regulatory protein